MYISGQEARGLKRHTGYVRGWVNSNAVGTPRRCTSARLCVYVPVDVRRRARWGDLLTQFVENMTQPRATRSLSLYTPLSISARLLRSLSRPLPGIPPPPPRLLLPPATLSCSRTLPSCVQPSHSQTLSLPSTRVPSSSLLCVRLSFAPLPPTLLPAPPSLPAPSSLLASRARTLLLAKSRARHRLSLSASHAASLALERSLTLTFSLPRTLCLLLLFFLFPPVPHIPTAHLFSRYSHTLSRISDRAFLP